MLAGKAIRVFLTCLYMVLIGCSEQGIQDSSKVSRDYQLVNNSENEPINTERIVSTSDSIPDYSQDSQDEGDGSNKIDLLIDENNDMAYEIDSQPVEVVRHLSDELGDVFDHIKLWYGGGMTKEQIKAISNGESGDIAFNQRVVVASLDKDGTCYSRIKEFEISTNKLMNGEEFDLFVTENC